MGFKRQKTTLVSERQEALLVVALRKNSSTRQDKLVVTLEVCIYCKELARHFNIAKILNQPLKCRLFGDEKLKSKTTWVDGTLVSRYGVSAFINNDVYYQDCRETWSLSDDS